MVPEDKTAEIQAVKAELPDNQEDSVDAAPPAGERDEEVAGEPTDVSAKEQKEEDAIKEEEVDWSADKQDADGAEEVKEEEEENEAADAMECEENLAQQEEKEEDQQAAKELEFDAELDHRARVGEPVILNEFDATLDVIASTGSGVVSSLSQGGFQYLLSGVRANVGAKAGRYFFEVKVLEKLPDAEHTLSVGVSLARSSLFLGGGDTSNVCFDSFTGSYLAATPQDAKAHKKKACKDFIRSGRVVGVLLNLDARSPYANTISIFLDGVRAGDPQPLPEHLVGKILYPTVNFKNMTLAVNLGGGGVMLQALPFRCRTFADISADDAEVSPIGRPEDNKFSVLIPVGLPEEGFFEHVDRLLERHPEYVELSDRALLDWCLKSDLKNRDRLKGTGTLDRPGFAFGITAIDNKQAKGMLKTLSLLARRNYIVVEAKANLLSKEREELIKRFSETCYKIMASIAVGEPSAEHKEWVRAKILADPAHKKAKKKEDEEIKEEDEDIGRSAGEPPAKKPKLEEKTDCDEIGMQGDVGPTEKETDSPNAELDVWHLPPKVPAIREVAEKLVAAEYAEFSFPTKEEGFDDIDYSWLPETSAEEYLNKWITDKKWSLVIEGLTPGEWFAEKYSAWQKAQFQMMTKQKDTKKAGRAVAEDKDNGTSSAKANDVEDTADSPEALHATSVDGKLLYAAFEHEDWALLQARYELHLMIHGFLRDAKDTFYIGIPEEHLLHYGKVYLKSIPWSPRLVGCKTLAEALEMLRDTVQIESKNNMNFVTSTHSEDTDLLTFLKLVEEDRADRKRRIEAGDETAVLKIPKALEPIKQGKGKGKGNQSSRKGERKGESKGSKSGGAADRKTARVPLTSRAGSLQPKLKMMQRTLGKRPTLAAGKLAVASRPLRQLTSLALAARPSAIPTPGAARTWGRDRAPLRPQEPAQRGLKRPLTNPSTSRPVVAPRVVRQPVAERRFAGVGKDSVRGSTWRPAVASYPVPRPVHRVEASHSRASSVGTWGGSYKAADSRHSNAARPALFPPPSSRGAFQSTSRPASYSGSYGSGAGHRQSTTLRHGGGDKIGSYRSAVGGFDHKASSGRYSSSSSLADPRASSRRPSDSGRDRGYSSAGHGAASSSARVPGGGKRGSRRSGH